MSMWSITLPPPSGLASRCMRSPATWRSTPRGRRTFCRRCWIAEDRLEKLIVASSMSIYGEGQYRCEEHGMVAPPPRPAAQLRAKQLAGGVSAMRAAAGAGGDRRGQAAAVQLNLCARQKRPGRDVPAVRPHLWRAGGGAALLQYLRHPAGALESLHGSGCDLCLAVIEPAAHR